MGKIDHLSLREPRERRLWSLWEMLESYLPIYQLALDLQALWTEAQQWRLTAQSEIFASDTIRFQALLEAIRQKCLDYGFTHTSELAARLLKRDPPKTYADMMSILTHMNDSLSQELEKEAVFRIPYERKTYFERDDLFGPAVATAFPSCARDIKKAGSCYALEQEDACVHHLMLVLERGLAALATKVGVAFHYTDWKKLIDLVEAKLKSGAVPRGPELDFYRDVNSQFGFLKEAYRKHSAHARDDFYDMLKALHIFNHVKDFMQALAKGGLSD